MNLCAVLAGCCILAAIALGAFFITIGGARAAEIEVLACKQPAACIEGEGIVRMPLALIHSGNRALARALEQIDEQQAEINRLRAKLGCA